MNEGVLKKVRLYLVNEHRTLRGARSSRAGH